jgi:hypothetical protein
MITGRQFFGRARPDVAWSPYALTRSVLRAWWCADDWTNAALSTDDGSGLLSSWKDRINVINTTATTTLRPTAAAASFTGTDGVSRAGVTFNGSTTAMTTTTLTALPTGATAGEIFIVGDFSTGTSIGYGTTGGALARRITYSQSPAITLSDGSASLGTTIANGPHIVNGWWNGTQMGGSIDGTDLTPVTIATLNTSTARLRLGATVGASAGTFGNGVLRHAQITTLLDATLRQRLVGYLAWESGLQSLLPAGHPYKSSAP